MGFRLTYVAIDGSEPSLWFAISIAFVIAFLAGRNAGASVGRIPDRNRRQIAGTGVLVAAFVAAELLTRILLEVIFALRHEGATACPIGVNLQLVLPSLAGVGAVAWSCCVRRIADAPPMAPEQSAQAR